MLCKTGRQLQNAGWPCLLTLDTIPFFVLWVTKVLMWPFALGEALLPGWGLCSRSLLRISIGFSCWCLLLRFSLRSISLIHTFIVFKLNQSLKSSWFLLPQFCSQMLMLFKNDLKIFGNFFFEGIFTGDFRSTVKYPLFCSLHLKIHVPAFLNICFLFLLIFITKARGLQTHVGLWSN